MLFSNLIALLPDEQDGTLSEVCRRQVRIIRLFCFNEADCRANAAAFYGFAARCAAWASEHDDADSLNAFISTWLVFRFQ